MWDTPGMRDTSHASMAVRLQFGGPPLSRVYGKHWISRDNRIHQASTGWGRQVEAISKMWIGVQGPAHRRDFTSLCLEIVFNKARGDKKAEHTRYYVSIFCRLATPPWALRRVFETGYRHMSNCRNFPGHFTKWRLLWPRHFEVKL